MDILAHRFLRRTPRPADTENSAMASLGYRADIDGLRAISALMVVGLHVGAIRGGRVGVGIFFVISGYLISGIIMRSLQDQRFSFLSFYARRVRRIFPALALVLIAVLVWGWLLLLEDEYRELGKKVSLGALFLMNLTEPVQPDPHLDVPRMLLNQWSLGVEEQFYLAWPLFLYATWRWVRNHFVLIVLGVVGLSFFLDLAIGMRQPWQAYFLPWTRVWQLASGCALAYVDLSRVETRLELEGAARSLGPSRDVNWRAHVKGFLGAGILTMSAWRTGADDVVAYPALWHVGPTIGAVLLISAGPASWFNRRVLSAAPLVFIGLISYPLYLWHVPLLNMLRFSVPDPTSVMTIAVVGGASLLSFLTYRYVELPLRSSSHPRLATSLILATTAACGAFGGLVYLTIIPARSVPADIGAYVAAATEDWLPKTVGNNWSKAPADFMLLGAAERRTLYVGDSSMQQYYLRLSALLMERQAHDRGAVFATRAECAPGAVEISDIAATEREACRQLIQRITDYALNSNVDTVVIAASWLRYFRGYDGVGSLRPRSEGAFDALESFMEVLTKAGKRVYLVLDIPQAAQFDPRKMIHRSIIPPGFYIGPDVPRNVQKSRVAAATGSVSSKLVGIAKRTGARVIDPMLALCDELNCRTTRVDGKPMYRDAVTLRPSYVRDSLSFMDETLLEAPH